MRFVLSVLWISLAVAWLSGIVFITRVIGGYKWIGHMGQTRPVFMLLLIAALCIASGIALLAMRRLPKLLSVGVAGIAGLYLFNALGMFVLISINGHVGAVMLPFAVVSNVLPTSTQFVGMPTGNASLLILPVATLLVWLVSLPVGRIADSSSHDA